MKAPIVVVGLGQLGTFFAEQFLRMGHPIVPVSRSTRWSDVSAIAPDPALVLVATGEESLQPALAALPAAYRSKVALLQNELRPEQWRDLEGPTVAVIWFERKSHRPPAVVLPSVLSGPNADLLAEALRLADVPHRIVPPDELGPELCLKNLYILGLNLAGLAVSGPAGDLLTVHDQLFHDLTIDLLQLEAALFACEFDRKALETDLREAILADPNHSTAGRTARARLTRTLAHAARAGLTLPALERIAEAAPVPQHRRG
jgi:hypothetical protein